MIFSLICENLLTPSNSIFRNAYKDKLIEVYVSGSSSQYINGSKQLTKPEYAFDQVDKVYDWCSNCGRSHDEHPWAIYSIKNRVMRIQGYYLKAGCCDDGAECCCFDNLYCCDCCLYSWSLQISNDNTTWKTVHKVEKDSEMRRCKEKIYKFSETYTTKYVRLIQDDTCPGDPPCIALNKIELLGVLDGDNGIVFEEQENEDDDVSIIGHISKNRVN
ncbi:hypothetical protein TVAG_050190 [Trichomonas vaginalis G3]|uniref:F5/8 type C domain-containing protein n=1 Tax=Trichomonas vaginalis (strain ATCC PRA-98 / G3) TaxID=412133 RepID=A2EJE7_TRIV3|nr:hypothetical protein TVAGG3_0389540 [Trichomonas vaginalis G3]EAY07204.1 hypothetical protein TVAG_050190 [Trichomonas vaginalis G3]KAI5533892.1 hypothetical protein TVAGG3_0389540 [Trichomonas vaginalis G3]|eukprot:XP_001319427.1 hypothetical protein [Trichomonas vaginalis G3]